MRVLVTGGAGYIGSHVALQLGEAGHDVVVYDNLSAGHRWAVLAGELVEGDVADAPALARLFERHRFDAVVHFAAHLDVAESVADPLKYYGNNTRNTLGLLQACARAGVDRFVFSSTAAVYGIPSSSPIAESEPLNPINAYGASKMMSERMLMDLAASSPLRYVVLRYFNACGAESQGRIGEAHHPETHLIPLILRAALGKRPSITIYGTDYPTADGTCVRDYIHVEDLAHAHVEALRYLGEGGASKVLNCGYGHGYSVQQVIDTVKAVSGLDFPVEIGDRRPGDPPELVADISRISELFGWQPRFDDLEVIVAHALQWEKNQIKEPT